MLFLSAIADVLVLLPASLGLIAGLAGSGARLQADAFAKALAACMAATFLSKFVLAICAWGPLLAGMRSPSGHVAFATLFYGSLALLVSDGRSRVWATATKAAAVAIVFGVAVSRVALHAHSRRETLAGALIGGLALLLFRALRPAPTDAPLNVAAALRWAPLAGVYVGALALLANRWTPEPWIDAWAYRVGVLAGLCS